MARRNRAQWFQPMARAYEAKVICRACPVQPRCLAWALDHGVTDGVWGGTTADERRLIRRPTSRPTCNQEDHDGIATSERSAANKEYVRRLLEQRQPGFPAALELAVDLLGRELDPSEATHSGPC